MAQLIDQHLERMAELAQADRRSYRRHLLTELRDRARRTAHLHLQRAQGGAAYARRARDFDRMILCCFLLRLSTHKIATALLPGSVPAGQPGH